VSFSHRVSLRQIEYVVDGSINKFETFKFVQSRLDQKPRARL
jgi:hypothetical protein